MEQICNNLNSEVLRWYRSLLLLITLIINWSVNWSVNWLLIGLLISHEARLYKLMYGKPLDQYILRDIFSWCRYSEQDSKMIIFFNLIFDYCKSRFNFTMPNFFFEITLNSNVPPSGSTFWAGLEAQTIRGARGGHAHSPTKSGPKTKNIK